MRSIAAFKHWRQWLNSSRPRIFVWYFLLTAFSSVISILATQQILYERILDQSQEYVSRKVKEFQQMVRQSPTDLTVPPDRQAAALFDSFLSQYEPIDLDDYAIALLQGQVYQYTDQFPTEVLSQDAAVIQSWGQITTANRGASRHRSVNCFILLNRLS